MLIAIDPVYVLSGFLLGFLVGQTGVGGGSLMTPLLVLLFHIAPGTAVGTDLLYAAVAKTVGIFATVRGPMPKRRAASRRLIPSMRTAYRTLAYSSTPFIPQPSAINAKSFPPTEFYSGATGPTGRITEGFCLRRLHPSGTAPYFVL